MNNFTFSVDLITVWHRCWVCASCDALVCIFRRVDRGAYRCSVDLMMLPCALEFRCFGDGAAYSSFRRFGWCGVCVCFFFFSCFDGG